MSAPSRVPFPAIGFSAALLALSFPLADAGPLSGPLGWCALAAYVPLLAWAIDQKQAAPIGRVFAITLLVHLLAYGAAFHWVVFHSNPITVAASVGGLMTLAMLASIPLTIARWAAKRGGSGWLLPAWAALTLGLEHLLSMGPWALPWPVLSMTQATLPHAGLARWIGAPGLTALVLLTNATLAAWLIRDWASPWRLRGVGIALGLTFLLAPLLQLPDEAGSHVQTGTLNAPRAELLIVQPGMDVESWVRTDAAAVNLLMHQTKAALAPERSDTCSDSTTPPPAPNDPAPNDPVPNDPAPNDPAPNDPAPNDPAPNASTPNASTPSVIVWPESALFDVSFAITDYDWQIHAFLRSLPAPLLTGAMLESPRKVSPTRAFFQNAALWIDPRDATHIPSPRANDNDLLDRPPVYAKHHLVPFAERVPFSGAIPALQQLAVPSGGVAESGGIAAYVPGPGPTVFPPPAATARSTPSVADVQHRSFRVAPLICFETIIGPYVRAASMPANTHTGPSVLVGLSHVGWWGRSAILPQYRALTSLRALETGLPVVVATVRAPSFTAHPDGSVTLHTDWMQRTAVRVRVPRASRAPFATWAGWIHAGIALLLVGATRIASVHRLSRSGA